ncbi:MAG: glycerol acyltransferase [Bacteroidetes bacterium GWF2_33_38]|nr:MAG: glycerol acyltransferase [Bacteroidetes bacterium GWF2_33_38]
MIKEKKSNDFQLVDVENIIRIKNPKILKFLPRFVIRYLKRIIHQDEINKFITDNKDNFGLDFVHSYIKTFNVGVNLVGKENIPSSGKFIFVSNHPLGGMESMVLMAAISEKFEKQKFMVNDILMYLKNLQEVFLPINKHGKNPQDYVKQLDEAFNSDAQILIFPAGMVSRKIKGKIVDLEWKKSFITSAKKYNRDIIPVYIEARNSNFFYRLSNIRKMLGIKANIEMLYLVDEMFKQRGNTISLYFGNSISIDFFDKSKSAVEWANYVKKIVYNLPKAQRQNN